MKFITASSAASPAGPYSPAVRAPNLLFVSGHRCTQIQTLTGNEFLQQII